MAPVRRRYLIQKYSNSNNRGVKILNIVPCRVVCSPIAPKPVSLDAEFNWVYGSRATGRKPNIRTSFKTLWRQNEASLTLGPSEKNVQNQIFFLFGRSRFLGNWLLVGRVEFSKTSNISAQVAEGYFIHDSSC